MALSLSSLGQFALPQANINSDITPQLAGLVQSINKGMERKSLADLGKDLASGNVDYRQAAGRLAELGNTQGMMQMLGLAEAKDKLARETAAAQQFSGSLSNILGPNASSAAIGRPVAPGPVIPNDSNALPGQAGMDARLADRSQDFIQDHPGTYLSSGVRSTADQARLYADRANNPNPVARPGTSRHERGLAVDIGGMTPEQRALLSQYGLAQPVANDPPHVELAPQGAPVQVAQAGGGLNLGVAQVPALLGAIANPNLPSAQKEVAKTLLTRALDEAKTPDKIRALQQLKADSGFQGSLLDLEERLKAAGKTEVNINQTGEKEYEKQSAKDFAEMNRKMIEGAQSARMKLGTLTRMDQLLSDPKIYSGAGGEQVLTAKKLAKAAGFDVGDVSGPEAIRAIGNQFALELRNPAGGAGMPGAMSDKDREFLQASVPGLTQTPEGNRKIVDYMKRVAQRSLDVERLRQDYVKKNGRLNEGFYRELDQYSSAHPLFPEADKQGPSTAPPMQGARQAPDGNWYVQQNGKYYRVDQ